MVFYANESGEGIAVSGLDGHWKDIGIAVGTAAVAIVAAIIAANMAAKSDADLNDNRYVERIVQLENDRARMLERLADFEAQLEQAETVVQTISLGSGDDPKLAELERALQDLRGQVEAAGPVGEVPSVDAVVAALMANHLDELRGPKGEPGPIGPEGPQGPAGPRSGLGGPGAAGSAESSSNAPDTGSVIEFIEGRNQFVGAPNSLVQVAKANDCFEIEGIDQLVGMVFENQSLICWQGKPLASLLFINGGRYMSVKTTWDKDSTALYAGDTLALHDTGKSFLLTSINKDDATFVGGILSE